MMDTEDLQSELLALRRLYGLLINDEHTVEDAGSEKLDGNARRLLLKLLDDAAIKAFETHTKVLGTQFRASYSPWSMPQGQSKNGLNLPPLNLRNTPTNIAYPSQQNVDLLTGEEIFNEPTNQVVSFRRSNSISAGESGFRLKRCRVCQKPKVKQLTREMSTQASKEMNSNNLSQNENHKRSWEVQHEPNRVGASVFLSNSPLTSDFFESLTLTSFIDQEDEVSRDASTKVLQLESCISSLQVAAKHVNTFLNDSEDESSQIGNFVVGRSEPNSSTSQRIWKPRDIAHRWHDQTERSIKELTLQSPLVNTMLPSSRTMSQEIEEPVGSKNEMFNQMQNQYDLMPEETYYPFHSHGVSSNLDYLVDKNRFLHLNLSSQIDREQFDHSQMAKKETTSQEVEEPVVNKLAMFNQMKNQYDHMPEETYYPSHSGVSSNMDYSVDTDRFLHRTLSSQINREQYDHSQMAKKEAMSREVEEPVVNKLEMFNHTTKQYDNIPEEAYYPSHRGGVSSNLDYSADKNRFLRRNLSSQINSEQFDHLQMAKKEAMCQEVETNYPSHSRGGPSNLDYSVDRKRFLHMKMSSQKNREQLDQLQMTKREAMRTPEMTERSVPPVKYSRHNNEQQEAEFMQRKKPDSTYKDQMDHYRGKHEPKRSVSPVRQWISDSPVSSSNYSSSRSALSQSQNPSLSESQSQSEQGSISSSDSEGSSLPHREAYSGSSSRSLEKSESELSSVSSQDQSPSMSSSYESSGSKSKEIPIKGYKKGDPKEEYKKGDQKEPTKGYKKNDCKALTIYKGDQKEPKMKRVGQLKKLKDKLAIIFNHHHHHHHHHHHDSGDNNHKKSFWKKAGKAIGHNRKKVEAYGEQAVNKLKKTAVVVRKVGNKNQKRQLQALVGGFLKHTQHIKKSKKSKSDIKRLTYHSSGQHGGGKKAKKMQWWQMLRRQRKIKRLEKLRGKVEHVSKFVK